MYYYLIISLNKHKLHKTITLSFVFQPLKSKKALTFLSEDTVISNFTQFYISQGSSSPRCYSPSKSIHSKTGVWTSFASSSPRSKGHSKCYNRFCMLLLLVRAFTWEIDVSILSLNTCLRHSYHSLQFLIPSLEHSKGFFV